MLHQNLSFQEINDALVKVDATTEAAEAHGILCGMICISGKGDVKNWLEHVLGEQDVNNPYLQETKNILMDLHDATLTEIIEGNYDLDLLLPGDDDPLDIRVDDLSNWCQGFLFGLSMSGLTDINNLPQEASEILQDMMDISKAGFNPDEDDDENETAFAEIVEYLKIGAYVIYNTFNNSGHTTNSLTVH